MSQDPYGQQDPYRSGNYEDYSQGYSSAPQQPAPPYGQPPQQPPAPSYGQAPFPQPAYGQPAADPYGQPTYSDPMYGQPAYTQPGYAQGYQPTPSYGLAPYSASLDANPRPSVTMTQAVKLWLKNWKNFSGRASRSEYWWVYLLNVIVMFVVMLIAMALVFIVVAATNGSDAGAGLAMLAAYGLVGLAGLAMFIPSLSLAIRRLHDINQSGWLALLYLIPNIGGIVMIVLEAQPSNPAGARFDDRAQPLYGPENI